MDKEGKVHALANTCRHRGKRLLNDCDPQNARQLHAIVCPYHAWKYDLKGKLLNARGDENDLMKGMCLRNLKVQQAGGITFYIGSNKTFEHLNQLNYVFESLSLTEGIISAKRVYHVNANWKLWTENFLECWHCAPNHPELTDSLGFIKQFENGREDLYIQDDMEWRKKAMKNGWNPPEDIDFQSDDALFHFNVSMPLGAGKLTASQTGERLGPTLGNAEGMEGGAVFGCMGPMLFYLAYVDYVVLFSVRPSSVNRTNIHTYWITSKDFNSYNVESLTWLWDTTLRQDITLVEETQQGVSSLYYTPGPFQADEYRTQAFTYWWNLWYTKNKK